MTMRERVSEGGEIGLLGWGESQRELGVGEREVGKSVTVAT